MSNFEATTSISNLKLRERFKALHNRREEARKKNHEEVIEEDRRSKLPANFAAKRNREEWEMHEIEEQKEYTAKGQDYERIKALNTQADIADKLEAAKRRKTNPDNGFSSYEAMSIRQYERLTKGLQANMETYEKMKEVIGKPQFYPTANTLIQGDHYPTESVIDKLVDDVKEQMKKRDQYHRRRMFDPDDEVNYINERNRKFNQKLDRFYDKYTENIKEDLERGTAI